MKKHILVSSIFLTLASTAALAQGAAATVQRDVNQQSRIEQGLRSGSLSTKEAGRLEREESHVDRMQANALRDGKLSPAERQRLHQAQDKVSQDIEVAKHNGVSGNPNSASSQRMQADVQRNINQERRIEQGVRSGELSGGETARLERNQAHVGRMEARAAANGHLGRGEQIAIQHEENKQSHRIHKAKAGG